MEKEIKNAAADERAAFFSLVTHPLKLRLYLLKNLPAAFFSGLKVVQATEELCITSVPYKRFTQNPFRSTYFACLSMAAELSTGLLAMAAIQDKKHSVSMLITGMEGKFHKKATGLSVFTCKDGLLIAEAIAASRTSGESRQVKAHSAGRNERGEVIAEFWFEWSFKARQSVQNR